MENLKRILGLLDEGKRIYQIYEQNEVQREEFFYCQLMHQIVFGEKGFVETLGHVWNLVHDPRFITIENQFIIDRRPFFGGDARLGKQYINDDGTFSSTVSDLEQYSEILGEGRNFHNVLVHPKEKCPIRLWLERIHRGYTTIKPHLALKCCCPVDQKIDPTSFKDASDEDIWALIQQESPNRAFLRLNVPSFYGKQMFALIKADLIGLIHDYAETPLIDSYIYLRDNGVVVAAEDVQKIDPNGVDHQRVLQEIDILEQALTHRATLRVTAAKILNILHLDEHIERMKDVDGTPLELTDLERDQLLEIVYTSEWPDKKTELMMNLISFLNRCVVTPFEERQKRQLTNASIKAQVIIAGLKNGSVIPINHYSEPVVEIPDDSETDVMHYAGMLDSLQKNEFKAELFQIYVSAEQEGELGVLDLLTPIFDPNYELDREGYFNVLRAITHQARSLRVVDPDEVVPRGTTDTSAVKRDVREFEGEYNG